MCINVFNKSELNLLLGLYGVLKQEALNANAENLYTKFTEFNVVFLPFNVSKNIIKCPE